MSNYLISIGGTGARCVESILHLCDCGYMNIDELKILIIDSDSSCGNKTRAEELIKMYNDCRDSVRYAEHDTKFFKTKISTVFTPTSSFAKKRQYSISPVVTKDGSRFTIKENMVGSNNREAINLMKALYSEEEYTRNITEGFYAHPSIGALLFSRWIKNNSPEFDDMLKNISLESAREDVNIFIVGSAFGGTGASGFPSIAKRLRNQTINSNNIVNISGCFLLPYFSFDGSDENSTVNHTRFDLNSKNALMFYKEQGLFKDYDSIYLLADPKKQSRGIHNEEGTTQRNWAHIIEIFVGLASFDFYKRALTGVSFDDSSKWLATSILASDLPDIIWEDFPDSENLKSDFERFVLFNYSSSICIMNKIFNVSSDGIFSLKKASHIKLDSFSCKPFIEKKFLSSSISSDLRTEPFVALFRYLTEHAKWLFQILHEFKPVTCENCENCNKSITEIQNCINSQLIYKNLFKSDMLYKRAFMYDYIMMNQNKENQFEWINNYMFENQFDDRSLVDSTRKNIKISDIFRKFNSITINSKDVSNATKELLTKAFDSI